MSAPLRTAEQLRSDADRYDRIADLYAQDIAVISGRARFQRDQRNYRTADQLDAEVERLVFEEQEALFAAIGCRLTAARIEVRVERAAALTEIGRAA